MSSTHAHGGRLFRGVMIVLVVATTAHEASNAEEDADDNRISMIFFAPKEPVPVDLQIDVSGSLWRAWAAGFSTSLQEIVVQSRSDVPPCRQAAASTAIHPISSAVPPSGATAPQGIPRNLGPPMTSRYKDPQNSVIPAVNDHAAALSARESCCRFHSPTANSARACHM